ncbi:MAG: SDR family oxidoreductase [Alphaproteobacteria bacterium]|nr:SDR family oxidoreductase [Alphaproteobacteria bacterium]MBT5160281.1 SDR family oxidoreductase [Alphaproteobacteria bacterium]MBT6385560.1 SDR family oxidoreductase [Alphaproteobacteria bacterium]
MATTSPTLPQAFDLSGKHALITGGAGLLGIEHACALVETGAAIVLTDLDQSALDRAKADILNRHPDGIIIALQMDVTDRDAIKSANDKLQESDISPDILINNAAIDSKVDDQGRIAGGGRFEDFDLDDWQLQLDVGLTGAFLCSQIFGPQMAARGHGTILNIASDLSVIAPDQRLYRDDKLPEDQQQKKPVTYSVIKTGLLGLTRYLAAYWAAQGVRVNALSPGGVQTNQGAEFVTRLSNLIPAGRMAQKNEYASAIQFLCSDASQFMTGQNIVMDGGRSII